MIDTKRYYALSGIAILLVVSISLISFLLPEQAEILITGKATSTVYIRQLPPETCNIDFEEGWNFVSFYCEFGVDPLEDTLVNESNETLDFSAIFTYTASDTDDPWKSYNGSLPNYTVQQINKIDRRKGYWIYMNKEETYYKEGANFDYTAIGLQEGWNLIGYPTKNPKNITFVLSSVIDNYTRTESYQYINGTGVWLYHDAPNSGTMYEMEPKKAYWVNLNESGGIIVNW